VDRRDVAEEMRCDRIAVVESRRVLTDALTLRRHSREELRVLEDVRERLRGGLLRNRYRLVDRVLWAVELRLNRLGRLRQDVGEVLHRDGLFLWAEAALHRDRVDKGVLHEDVAVGVDDRTADSRLANEADSVALRLRRVALRVTDLEEPESREQRAEH